MNRQRRKEAQRLRDIIDEAHLAMSAGVLDDLQALHDEEQEAFDNMNEGLQQTETGQEIYAAAEYLDTAATEFDEAFQGLQRALDALDEVL